MFSWENYGDLRYLKITEMTEKGVKAIFTSRLGGVSKGNYSFLNLGLHTEDNSENVLENRRRIASILGLDFTEFVAAEQVHGDKIHIARKADRGRGAVDFKDSIKNVDALITDNKGLALISFYADCVPLFIYDPVKKIVALSHAGWKGTFLHIGPKTIAKMQEVYGTRPEDCLAGIGPAISKKNYEVDNKVNNLFRNKFYFAGQIISKISDGKYHLDLKKANFLSLVKAGVLRKNIVVSDLCTYKDSNFFYSYRRDNGKTGRMASIIVM